MKISYLIGVCNEEKYLRPLLQRLIDNIDEEDEIVVIFDEGNTTLEIHEILMRHATRINTYGHPLNHDFAAHKNFMASKCIGDYIINIDADELVDEVFIKNIKDILAANSSIDVMSIPRINIVTGITPTHTNKWGWRINERGWINFPDRQLRIWKTNSGITWKGKVHETLVGWKTIGHIPDSFEYANLFLLHHKDIERQEQQNKFYETI